MIKKIAIAVTVLTVGLLCFNYFYLKEVSAEADETRSFTVNKPYREVIIAFTKYESTEKIVNACGGKIIDHKWIDADLNVDRLLKPLATWKFRGVGAMVIEYETPYKTIRLDTTQKITADQDGLDSSMELSKPGKAIRYMRNVISIKPDGDKATTFYLSNSVVVKQRLPPAMHYNLKKDVIVNNRVATENTEKAIREICSAGRFSIPLNDVLK